MAVSLPPPHCSDSNNASSGVSPALQNQPDPNSGPTSSGRPRSPPPVGLPPVLSPPYWQVQQPRHQRAGSLASVASTNTNRPAPIRLEDNTEIYEGSNGSTDANSSQTYSSNGKAKSLSGGTDPAHANGHHPANIRWNDSLKSPPARSPLWARVVRITSHTTVAGTVRGVGDYVVWTCDVDTLDGGTIVLRKRYSEFVTLRNELQATFPRSLKSLPVLPPKSIVKRFKEGFLETRRAGLEFFLNCVLLNPEFAGSAVLKEFVFR